MVNNPLRGMGPKPKVLATRVNPLTLKNMGEKNPSPVAGASKIIFEKGLLSVLVPFLAEALFDAQRDSF